MLIKEVGMEVGLIDKSAVPETGEPSELMFMRLVLILTGTAFAVRGTAVVAWLKCSRGLAFALISIGLLVTAGNLRSLF
jgi:hypothetical protein